MHSTLNIPKLDTRLKALKEKYHFHSIKSNNLFIKLVSDYRDKLILDSSLRNSKTHLNDYVDLDGNILVTPNPIP